MKISVVTISFNQISFLKICIDSVLSQNHINIEYIIVDPGSTDGSRELIESYGDKVIPIFGSDLGPADGLNKGFSIATGDIFYFLNSDDVVYLDTFSKVASLFKIKKNIDVICGGGEIIDASGGFVSNVYPSRMSPKLYVNGAVTLFQQGLFFRAYVFNKIGGFNIINKSSWDGEFFLQISLNKFNIFRIMDNLAGFRIYPESITGSQRFKLINQLTQLRLYRLVYGENKNGNFFKRSIYRMLKLICNPLYVYKKLFG